MKSRFCTRDESALKEATARPIFLFQSRRWQHLGAPEGYAYDPDGCCLKVKADGGPELDEDRQYQILTDEELAEMVFDADGHDLPCALAEWNTERVFLTRQEAEQWGRDKSYNYRDGWRVYCVSAMGELAEAIEDGTEIPGNRVKQEVRS